MATVQIVVRAKISEIGHHAEMATAQIGVRAKISQIGHRVGMAIVQIVAHAVITIVVGRFQRQRVRAWIQRVDMPLVKFCASSTTISP